MLDDEILELLVLFVIVIFIIEYILCLYYLIIRKGYRMFL